MASMFVYIYFFCGVLMSFFLKIVAVFFFCLYFLFKVDLFSAVLNSALYGTMLFIFDMCNV